MVTFSLCVFNPSPWTNLKPPQSGGQNFQSLYRILQPIKAQLLALCQGVSFKHLNSTVHGTIFHITKWMLETIFSSLGPHLQRPNPYGLLSTSCLLFSFGSSHHFQHLRISFCFLVVFYSVFLDNCSKRNIYINLVDHIVRSFSN